MRGEPRRLDCWAGERENTAVREKQARENTADPQPGLDHIINVRMPRINIPFMENRKESLVSRVELHLQSEMSHSLSFPLSDRGPYLQWASSTSLEKLIFCCAVVLSSVSTDTGAALSLNERLPRLAPPALHSDREPHRNAWNEQDSVWRAPMCCATRAHGVTKEAKTTLLSSC